ncbi:hypothetical protein E2C01_042255 [Portunus trituberculatus]|uniref:Uncharacterized protein n=1 Tax=Portunus trituberculatus TaxID=210409 RepID=A0A5B7FPQ3_PORTR|nr:hypothetical protein [Portunus trituberculatus]
MDAISLQEAALSLLKNLGSSSRIARDRSGEPANYSETTAFGPSPSKFKPRKFAKTDMLGRLANLCPSALYTALCSSKATAQSSGSAHDSPPPWWLEGVR